MAQLNTEVFENKTKAFPEHKELIYSGGMSRLAGKRFHFIGIGGVGMSGLAQMLLKNKAIIAGSDQTATSVTDRLRTLGASIAIGHDGENVHLETEAVVISAAIMQDNPELKQARKNGCKVYKYAEMLGMLMEQYEGIGVSGTHGKSTTAGWLAWCLKQLDAEPNFVIGADISQLNCSSGTGDSKHFIAEACEYDRSFLSLHPKIVCILNVEQDHLDYYKDENDIIDAFREFATGIKSDGTVIANGDDANVAKIIKNLPSHICCQSFGLKQDSDFCAQNIKLDKGIYSFDVNHHGKILGRTHVSLPGRHNILNGLAVVAMAVTAGFEPQKVLEVLPGFTGMDRRLMLKAQAAGITILDDYAHHPTEIRASLEAIRQRYQTKRIWCIFQPHQYSRTRFFLDDFAESFKLADITIVPEIYFVRDMEESKKIINSEVLVRRIRDNGSEAVFIEGFAGICDYLLKNVKPGDTVITMGAGDIGKVADEYIQRLGKNS